MDLGLKTSYKNFIHSEECSTLLSNSDNYLIGRIVHNFRLNKWVDVEEELKMLAKEINATNSSKIEKFENEYVQLSNKLKDYISRISDAKDNGFSVNSQSVAAELIKVADKHPEYFEIFSFNYTDLNSLKSSFSNNFTLRYKHVHGSIAQNDIIVGFEDNVSGVDDFSFMIKTFNRNYISRHIRQSLSMADEVIFFGHSLGSTDYHYFAQFFKEKSKSNLRKCDSVKISFFTANNKSRIEIMNQLRKMNDTNTNLLFDQNNINFFCTFEQDMRYQIHHFLRRLDLECDADQKIQEFRL